MIIDMLNLKLNLQRSMVLMQITMYSGLSVPILGNSANSEKVPYSHSSCVLHNLHLIWHVNDHFANAWFASF